MKRWRAFPIEAHAFKMVGRTLKSYFLLSITIVLSFSLLLGYLLYTDSTLYNEYKQLFACRRGDIVIRDREMDDIRLKLLQQRIDEIEDTKMFVAYYVHFGHDERLFDAVSIGLEEGEILRITNVQSVLLPDYVWLDGLALVADFFSTSTDVIWLQERTEFCLKADEVILPEKLFRAMGYDQVEDPRYILKTEFGPPVELKVVGYSKSPVTLQYSKDSWSTTPAMYLSTKFIDEVGLNEPDKWEPVFGTATAICEWYIVLHSENPEQVLALVEQMGYAEYYSVHEQQNDALEHIRNEKGNKAIIACALLLLLGINLYSSFTNALNDRKFEIGVKRAIGASAGSIVRQFLYESVIVMVATTVISIAVVADVFIVYKYIYERIPDLYGNFNTWTIYISTHSIAMFGLCAVTLTVVFSLIFAYKSTRVEIVQYLKAE